jgi:hypothetical protein
MAPCWVFLRAALRLRFINKRLRLSVMSDRESPSKNEAQSAKWCCSNCNSDKMCCEQCGEQIELPSDEQQKAEKTKIELEKPIMAPIKFPRSLQPFENKNKLVMFIMRGLPGVGKTNFCRKMLHHYLELPLDVDGDGKVTTPMTAKLFHLYLGYILSTNDYFTTVNTNTGKITYDYNKWNVVEYHEKNKKRAERQVEFKITPLFIDNTNMEKWEITPYEGIAHEHGYNVVIVDPEALYEEGSPLRKVMRSITWLYANRNDRNIPLTTFQRLNDRFKQWQ